MAAHSGNAFREGEAPAEPEATFEIGAEEAAAATVSARDHWKLHGYWKG